jgi:hypothetical protein
VGNLHDISGEKVSVTAKLGYSGFEGIPRPSRLVEEHEEDCLIRQVAVRDAAFEFAS